MELTVAAASLVSLSSITFDYRWLNNSGANQGAGHPSLFDITVNGVVYDSQQATGNNPIGSIAFTEAKALLTGLNTVVITASEVDGPGNNIGIDNLVFNGTVIPEPSAALLLGLGALGLVARRRRT